MGQEHMHTHSPNERTPVALTRTHTCSAENTIASFQVSKHETLHRKSIRFMQRSRGLTGAVVRAAAHKIPGLLTCRAKLIDHISSPESHLITEPPSADPTSVESAPAHCD